MSDKEENDGIGPLETGRVTEKSDASGTDHEKLLVKVQELQKHVEVIGRKDPEFDIKRFFDGLEE